MLSQKRTITLLALVFTLLLTVSASVLAVNNDQSTLLTAQVTFDTPVSIQDVYAFSDDQDLIITEIIHTFEIGGETHTAGYLPQFGESPESVESTMNQLHHEFLLEMAAEPPEEQAVYSSDPLMQERLKTSLQEFQDQAAKPQTLEIRQINVYGKADTLKKLKASEKTPGELFIIDAGVTEQLRSQRSESNMLSAQSVPHWETWAPEEGFTLVQPHRWNGYRYVYNRFWWDNASGFDFRSTYEHDFFLNASDGSRYGPGTYFTKAEISGRRPAVRYWASNLPEPYLDSRYDDPAFQIAYTIGSSFAATIWEYNWFYTYIMIANGDSNIDSADLQAELGYRFFSNVYRNPWTITSRTHKDLISNRPGWHITVPNYINWRR